MSVIYPFYIDNVGLDVEFTREEAQTDYIDGYQPDKLSWYDNAGRGSVDLTEEGYGDIDPWASDSLLSTACGHVLLPNTILRDSSIERIVFTRSCWEGQMGS